MEQILETLGKKNVVDNLLIIGTGKRENSFSLSPKKIFNITG